ncbi:MAG: hypothetical protein U9M98_03620 [Patescibacteria group bacterium]|nr:hypothetical protein [Patescibacteria group bacterium]
MKILKREKNNKKWEAYNQRGYRNEAELQEIIYEDPSIIPIHEISEDRKEIKVAIKEFGLPGAGSSDIIGIDEDGKITIIEAKLAANAEIRRKVIGQILDYAAFLWKKTYEQFDAMVEEKKGNPLLDLMADLIEDEEWSEEEFRKAIGNNLYNGDFSLFILVDDVDDSLKRILEFINSSSFSGPQIYALAARYFKDSEDSEFLVPQIHGVNIKQTEAREEQPSKRKKWDKDSFFNELAKNINSDAFSLSKKLFKGVESLGEISFGTGAVTGSYTLKFPYKDDLVTIMHGWSDGRVEAVSGYFYYDDNLSNLAKNMAGRC